MDTGTLEGVKERNSWLESEVKILNARLLKIKQDVLYVESGNVDLNDLCIDIRIEFGMDRSEKHIER